MVRGSARALSLDPGAPDQRRPGGADEGQELRLEAENDAAPCGPCRPTRRPAGASSFIPRSQCSTNRIVRVGPANLDHRSEGFDTERDLGIEGDTADARGAIAGFRDHPTQPLSGVDRATFAELRIAEGGIIAAVDALRLRGVLCPWRWGGPTWWGSLVAYRSLGDPSGVEESGRLRTQKTLA